MPNVSKKRAADLDLVVATNQANYPILALVYSINDVEVDVVEAQIGTAYSSRPECVEKQPIKSYKIREDKEGRAYFGNGYHKFYLDQTIFV